MIVNNKINVKYLNNRNVLNYKYLDRKDTQMQQSTSTLWFLNILVFTIYNFVIIAKVCLTTI